LHFCSRKPDVIRAPVSGDGVFSGFYLFLRFIKSLKMNVNAILRLHKSKINFADKKTCCTFAALFQEWAARSRLNVLSTVGDNSAGQNAPLFIL
jgi:hypothetical protein